MESVSGRIVVPLLSYFGFMPFIEQSTYRAPFPFQNKHLNTIFPSLFRKVTGVHYERERVETPDEDFLDVDWARVGGDQLVIVLHGLEGNADRPYVRGIVKVMNQQGWDGLGINFRGCSGTNNRKARSYHSGDTADLDWIIQKVLKLDRYREIALVGFSLGGNVVLKYVGERGQALAAPISRVVGLSVPCDLHSCSYELSKWNNAVYMHRFMVSLKAKVMEKQHLLEGKIDFERMKKARSFFEFDDTVTGPIHGFAGAEDYWAQSSSLQFFPNITIPALMINAEDDSFLAPACYPRELIADLPMVHLETPKYGGHVGFYSPDSDGLYWSDRRVARFIEQGE